MKYILAILILCASSIVRAEDITLEEAQKNYRELALINLVAFSDYVQKHYNPQVYLKHLNPRAVQASKSEKGLLLWNPMFLQITPPSEYPSRDNVWQATNILWKSSALTYIEHAHIQPLIEATKFVPSGSPAAVLKVEDDIARAHEIMQSLEGQPWSVTNMLRAAFADNVINNPEDHAETMEFAEHMK